MTYTFSKDLGRASFRLYYNKISLYVIGPTSSFNRSITLNRTSIFLKVTAITPIYIIIIICTFLLQYHNNAYIYFIISCTLRSFLQNNRYQVFWLQKFLLNCPLFVPLFVYYIDAKKNLYNIFDLKYCLDQKQLYRKILAMGIHKSFHLFVNEIIIIL